MGKEKYGNLVKSKFEEWLNNNAGEGKTKLSEFDDNEYVVEFIESKRIYNVNGEGDIVEGGSSIAKEDTTPGEFEGKGTEEDPYIIMSIEDLVSLSRNVSNGESYDEKYFKLGKTLSFNSELSYVNPNTTEYNEFLGITDNNVGLKEALTNEKYEGFKPIRSENKTFSGNFNGDNKSIKKLYINNSESYTGFIANGAGNMYNLELTGKITSTGDFVGAFMGRSWSKIENCISRVDIQSTGSYIGGITGSGGTATNCINYGSVNGKDMIGGIGRMGCSLYRLQKLWRNYRKKQSWWNRRTTRKYYKLYKLWKN